MAYVNLPPSISQPTGILRLQFDPGSKLVVFGDSITGQGWASSAGCLQSMLNAALTPGTFTLVESGVSGNTSADGLARITDVTGLSGVTHVIVEFGVNDIVQFAGAGLSNFISNMTTIFADIKAMYSPPTLAPVKVAACSVCSVQEFYPDSVYGQIIDSYNIALWALCDAKGVAFIDWRTPLQQFEATRNYPGSVNPAQLTTDGIHPTLVGKQRMSTAAMKAFMVPVNGGI